MPKTIQLAAVLPATPDRLYAMYLDPQAHAAIIGHLVVIDQAPGSVFQAFDGVLSGRMLHVSKGRLIVQTWRSSNWPSDAIDSILVMSFFPEGVGGRIELTQINVPDEDFAGVCHGWERYYWIPWRQYLEANLHG